MAGKTNTEQIQELGKDMIRVTEQLANFEERLHAESAELRADLRRAVDLLNSLVSRVAVLETRCNQLEKLQDEGDRRRWRVWLALLGSALAVIVALLRK